MATRNIKPEVLTFIKALTYRQYSRFFIISIYNKNKEIFLETESAMNIDEKSNTKTAFQLINQVLHHFLKIHSF